MLYFSSPAKSGKIGQTGYSRVAQKLIEALGKSDIPITCDPKVDDVQIWYGQPPYPENELEPWRHERKCNTFLTYTMFESTVLPDGWVEFINDREGLITPSRWCNDWFRECGVNVPIDVCHHGVDPIEFPYLERDKDREYFTFIWQGVNPRDRKGCEIVREAYSKLRLPKTRLILKATPLYSPRFYSQVGGITEIWDWYTEKQMLEIYRQADFSINPTSGEGFGLIPLEHAATGLAVAVTSFSGCLEYLDELPEMIGINWKVKPTYFRPILGDDGYDAKPDIEHICFIMEWAAKHRQTVREAGKALSEQVHKNWTWKRAIKQIKGIYKKYAQLNA